MNKEPNTKCPYCGASMRKNWYELTAGHANALIKIYLRVIEKGENKVNVPKEVHMDKVEYTVYQKLHMFALIAKVKENGRNKKGWYVVTNRGAKFVHGDVAIPDAVQSFRDRIVGHSENYITIKDVLKSSPYWGDYENIKYEIAENEDLIGLKVLSKKPEQTKLF